MARITLGLGLLLIALGLVGYFASGMASLTAMIPAIPGAVFALLGLLTLWQPTWRKHTMHTPQSRSRCSWQCSWSVCSSARR
ncbi:MAG: hypothetical protein WD534_14285 [Phycisphaeraceae bacterium]